MAVIIKLDCGRCRTYLELEAGDTVLELNQKGTVGKLIFHCPVCNERRERPVEGLHLSALIAAGVGYFTPRPLICEGDVDQFVFQLDRRTDSEIWEELEQ